MPDALTIRPATPNDAQSIARIRVRSSDLAHPCSGVAVCISGFNISGLPRFAQRRQRHRADARVPQPASPELATQQVSVRAGFERR